MAAVGDGVGPADADTPAIGAAGRRVSRRTALLAAGGLGVALATAGTAYSFAPDSVRKKVNPPHVFVPSAPEGRVRLERLNSVRRGRPVDLFTAVPAGHGDGAGLPVVIVLHGATGRPKDYRGAGFGFGHFVSQAVADGAPPFVLAGATGDQLRWEPSGTDDPRAMVLDELPRWLTERGFDASRRAVWGWSMGGYGALRLAETAPDFARATAAFSPAIAVGDEVFGGADLISRPLGVWCGTSDMFYAATTGFVRELPQAPAVAKYSPGAHTRQYWNSQILSAFGFLAGQLG